MLGDYAGVSNRFPPGREAGPIGALRRTRLSVLGHERYSETPTNTRRHERVSVEASGPYGPWGFKIPPPTPIDVRKMQGCPESQSRSRGHCLPVVCPTRSCSCHLIP
jgi:hypothetical protein